MTESNEERIFQAVLSCPHQITGEEVVLGYSDSKPGKNALAQLHSRIAEALALRTPSDGEVAGDAAVARAMTAFAANVRGQDPDWTDDVGEEGEILLTAPSGEYFAMEYPIRAAIAALSPGKE